MAARVTRQAKSALAAIAVGIALVASAWLATATTPPQGGAYPGGTTTTTSTTRMTTPTTTKTTTTTTITTTTTAPTTSTSVAALGSSVPASTTTASTPSAVGGSSQDPGSGADSFAGLPFTGAQTLSLVMLGGCCVASGVVLTRGARRRRHGS